MQQAVRVIYDMSEDTRIRELARMREKAMHDEASALKNAKDEGRAEGRAEGEVIGLERGKKLIISQMKAFGMSDEQISAILSGNS
ncbi:MAG: hypothetical protein J6A37_04590 [Oscillospiraceae bacterium]|nr:hypothetical protein [Oscillospiraceae bacterium]